jgi:hypothetical protein
LYSTPKTRFSLMVKPPNPVIASDLFEKTPLGSLLAVLFPRSEFHT